MRPYVSYRTCILPAFSARWILLLSAHGRRTTMPEVKSAPTPEEYDLYIADDGMIYRHFAGTGESMDISQDEGDLMEIFKALTDELEQSRKEIERLREALDTISGGHINRFPGAPNLDTPLSPLQFQAELLGWSQRVARAAIAGEATGGRDE